MSTADRPQGALARRFGLLDLMIVVFVIAPAFVILRDRHDRLGNQGGPSAYHTILAISALFNSLLMALTLALTAIGLRRPRPKLRVVLRRPGLAACVAASMAIVVMTARMTMKTYAMYSTPAIGGGSFRVQHLYGSIVDEQVRIGFAVTGAWLMLLLTRNWRSEPTWLDRTGRVLGWSWIALLLFYSAVPWIEPYLPKI
jgi:hypothetical protein